MHGLVRRAAAVSVAGLASLAIGTVVTPAVSHADCDYGQWWDPVASICRPLGVQLPLNCENGNWWDPVSNSCRPPVVPLGCQNGEWWDPGANVCRPPVLPPPQ